MARKEDNLVKGDEAHKLTVEEPGDLMDSAIVQQAAGIIEHLIPCRLCKHYQYELCMEGHKPTDDEFFCKDSKRDPKRELKRESKGD